MKKCDTDTQISPYRFQKIQINIRPSSKFKQEWSLFARVTDLVKSPDPTRVTFSKRNVTNEVSGTAFNF